MLLPGSVKIVSILVCLALWSSIAFAESETVASRGTLNLRGINFEQSDPVPLNGEWEVYWDQLYQEQDLVLSQIQPDGYFKIPGAWNQYPWVSKTGRKSFGTATFRLNVFLPDMPYQTIMRMLKIYIFPQSTAWSLQVFDAHGLVLSRKAQGGIVGMTAEETIPLSRPQQLWVEWKPEWVIILQISNFDEFFGGPTQQILLGAENRIEDDYVFTSGMHFLFLGMLIVAALYYLIVFVLTARDTTPLWMGWLCLLQAGFMLFSQHIPETLFPETYLWLVYRKVQLACWYFSMPTYLLLIHHVCPVYFRNSMITPLFRASMLVSFAALVLPPWFGGYIQPVFILIVLVSVVLIMRGLYFYYNDAKVLSGMMTTGWLVLLLSQLQLLFPYQNFLNPQIVSSTGIVFFIISHSVVLGVLKENSYQKTLRLSQMFTPFVPSPMLKRISMEGVDAIHPGDCRYEFMSILVADIRSLMKLSETMSHKDLLTFLNHYLARVTEPIEARHGFVYRIQGDTIVAIFDDRTKTDNDKADQSVLAAIELQEAIKVYNLHREKSRLAAIQVGIGVHSGHVILGVIGDDRHMEASIMGESIVTVMALEKLNKVYGTSILISQTTYNLLHDPMQYAIRFVDRIRIKGKMTPLSVYEVFDNDAPGLREDKMALIGLFEESVCLYHLGKYLQAAVLLKEYLFKISEDPIAKLYFAKCNEQIDAGKTDVSQTEFKEIEWTKDLEVGVVMIDQQHQELFRRVNKLMRAIQLEDSTETVPEMLDFLEEYVIIHFHAEEKLMMDTGYPHYHRHKQEHTQFIKVFRQLTELYENKQKGLFFLFHLQNHVIEWLVYHVAGEDRTLGRWYKNDRVK
ncbi:MAG: bacteriohemerythrin [SAR324 cluster bacterium]|nr:bacteriohemerythrin [SAR324 cluster bacterium]